MKKENRVFILLLAIIALAVVAILVWGFGAGRQEETVPAPVETKTTESSTKITIVDNEVLVPVEVEKEITSEIIQDGLNDMAFLVTQEYYFTEVTDYSSNLTATTEKWIIQIPLSESSYLISYDGKIFAGVDFEKITVKKEEETGNVTVCLPKAEIQSIDIDPDSFVLYSEKESILNPISVEDYNNSLKELEQKAEEKAIERGLLDQANENAKTVVENFVRGLLGEGEYTVTITVK